MLSYLISNAGPWLIWRPGVAVISSLFMLLGLNSLGIGLELKRFVVEHPLVQISMQPLKSLRDLDNLFLCSRYLLYNVLKGFNMFHVQPQLLSIDFNLLFLVLFRGRRLFLLLDVVLEWLAGRLFCDFDFLFLFPFSCCPLLCCSDLC